MKENSELEHRIYHIVENAYRYMRSPQETTEKIIKIIKEASTNESNQKSSTKS